MALGIGMLGLAGPASAVGTHTVTVAVTGSEGVGDLTVDLYTANSNNYDVYKQTDASGHAVFTNVPDDDYYADVTDSRPNGAYGYTYEPGTVNGADLTINIALTAVFHCTGATNAVGSYTVGSTLTAQVPGTANGTADPTDTYYTWYRITVANAHVYQTVVQYNDSATYTLQPEDAGHQIVVATYLYDSNANAETVCDYNATPVIAFPNTPVAALPVVTGKAKVGKKLAAHVGAVTPDTTVAYQWFRTKVVKKSHKTVLVAIKGAKSARYKLKSKDRGKKVFVAVTYNQPGHSATTVLSRGKKVK